MGKALKILVAADELPSSLWRELREPVEVTFARTGGEAMERLTAQRFRVVFLDIFLSGVDGLQLLRFLQRQESGASVILTSEAPSFQFARQGLLYGACDYLLRPLTREAVEEALGRIFLQEQFGDALVKELLPGLVSAFGTDQFPEAMTRSMGRITAERQDSIAGAESCRQLYRRLVEEVFQARPWLRLYIEEAECASFDEVRSSDDHLVQSALLRQSAGLSALVERLFPPGGESLREILEYLLTNVDALESQKQVAQRFYMSASSLSERFSGQLGCSYREYHQLLRLYRAACLMRRTDWTLSEICARLGFRDSSYFSRQFKRQTGASVADYRQEGGWDFQI